MHRHGQDQRTVKGYQGQHCIVWAKRPSAISFDEKVTTAWRNIKLPSIALSLSSMPDLASWSEDDHHLNDSEEAWEKSVDRTKPISNSPASTWLRDLSGQWTGLCAARVVDEPFSVTVRLMKKHINVIEWPQSCRKAAQGAEGLKDLKTFCTEQRA